MHHRDAIQILDLVDSGVIMLDNAQRIVFWNRFVSDTSLIDFKSIENKHWLDVFANLQDTRIHKAIDKAVKFNFPSILSYKLIKSFFPLYKKSLATKPPYLIVQSIIVKPLMEDNENRGCIIYINDVSAASNRERDLNQQSVELKNTIQRYRDVKSQFEQVFDHAHNGIIVFNSKGEIVNANQAATKLFSVKQGELLKQDIGKFIPILKDNYYDRQYKQYRYLADAEYEFDQKIFQPLEKYLSVSVSYIDDKQDDSHFFVFISDITERKIVEQELLNVNTELEEFAYRTSHDLRSPIVSSIGLVRMANKSLDMGDEVRTRKCLTHIENSLEKLEVLIKDILKLTEMKNIEETAQKVSVQAVIEQAFNDLCKLDGFDKVNKVVSLNGIDHIMTKESRFVMILENLISNAIKYRDPEETLSEIRIKAKIDNGNFILDVADNGMGIPEDQEEKLFTMFNRFHPKVAFGSGLGLYLIKKSAHVLGGDIKYLGQDKGACFRLTIPQPTKVC